MEQPAAVASNHAKPKPDGRNHGGQICFVEFLPGFEAGGKFPNIPHKKSAEIALESAQMANESGEAKKHFRHLFML